MLSKYTVIACVTLVAGCGTVVHGTSQVVSLATEPPGARCRAVQNGKTVAEVERTPAFVMVPRSRRDLDIICSKPGYADARLKNPSDLSPVYAADFVWFAWFPITMGVDAISGAGNAYDSPVTLKLSANSNAQPSIVTQPGK